MADVAMPQLGQKAMDEVWKRIIEKEEIMEQEVVDVVNEEVNPVEYRPASPEETLAELKVLAYDYIVKIEQYINQANEFKTKLAQISEEIQKIENR